MSLSRAILCLAALAAFGVRNQARAQDSVPLYEIRYVIVVNFLHSSGGTYSSNVYETTNQAEAEKMLQVFQAALESGDLQDMLGGNTTWVTGVELRTIVERNNFLQEPAEFNYSPLRTYDSQLQRTVDYSKP